MRRCTTANSRGSAANGLRHPSDTLRRIDLFGFHAVKAAEPLRNHAPEEKEGVWTQKNMVYCYHDKVGVAERKRTE